MVLKMVYGVSSTSTNQEKVKNVPVLFPSRAAGDTLPKEKRISVCVSVCECSSKLLFKTIFMNFLAVLFPSFITLNWYLPYSEYLFQLEICVFHKPSSWYQGRQKFLVAKKLFYCF